ncbi:MAG: SGNH/GDSL hydrolase family protein [Sandaracinus sp.]|nr:SGNH/GDSL hydrolase family protein [Sandaracinus sp.]MCB9604485.1 SGNH/GDSL hydrolase family protein [Sandaracinus sp.]MCB9621363.1 SGNH/GDSL hydrolase family protein [Sandaracinus sp.]
MRAVVLSSLFVLAACGDDALLIDARSDAGTATPSDGGTSDATVPVPDAEVSLHPAIYPADRTHSPISAYVVENLRAVRARGADLRDDVFSKVGASATASLSFLHCFAGDRVDLDGRDLDATLTHFRGGDADGTTPFDRDSACATPGWHAGRALEGDPSALETEVEAARPGFAVVMYGTNDINIVSLETYASNLLDLADALLDRGVVPIFTTVMPRDDDPEADALVDDFNLVVRAVAQARQVPMIDFHRELLPLSDHGLGPDGIHPTTSPSGGCVLTDESLVYGYNVRNLLTLEALDRMRRVLVADDAAPDAAGPAIEGEGTTSDPFVIEALPFVHVQSTLFSEQRALDRYDGCMATQDESGPERLYRLELDAPTNVVIRVHDRGSVDVDLHLLDAPTEAGCVARAHQELRASLGAGTHWLAIDTFVSAGTERAGEYLLTVAAEP